MEEFNIYFLFYEKNFSIITQIYNNYELSSLVDELMFSRLKHLGKDSINELEWINITGIQDFINLGKSNDQIYTSIYYSVKNSIYTTITMTFTYDDCLIIGFFMPIESTNDDRYKRAVINLKKEFNADMVSVFIEEPPPFSKNDFIKKSQLKSLTRTDKK